MSKRNLLLLAGLALVGYWFYTRKPMRKAKTAGQPIPEPKKMEAEKVATEQPKTIKVDLSKTGGQGNRPIFPDTMVRDFNTSKEATVAPPLIRVEMTK